MGAIAKMPTYEAYKDSGVEWLGEVPDDWELKPMKYLVDIRNGLDHKHVLSDNGYPVYGSGGQFAFATGYLLDGEAILLGRKGTIDRPLHVKEKFWTVDTMFYAVPKPFVNGRFFYYCCTSIPFTYYSTSTALPSMTQADLNGHVVAWPSYEVQCAVANFLDQKTAQIDEAIAIKEQQIALLKERKQIIIQKAVTQGLDPDVPMKDSGVDWIGEIPAHWELRANRSLYAERVEAGQEGLPLLMVSIHSGVSREEVSSEDNIRGRVRIEDKTKYIIVKPGDIVFNMMRAWQGGIGAVATEGMVSPAYIVAKPKADIIAEFFEYQYRCPEFIQQMDRYSKGITDFRKRLYWDSFKQLLTVVPPKDEQLKIIDQIQKLSESTEQAINLFQDQITKLKEYKTTLINSAVTGKIRITPEMVA